MKVHSDFIVDSYYVTDCPLVYVSEAEKKRVVERKGIIQGLGQQVQTPTVSSADSKKEVNSRAYYHPQPHYGY